MSGMKERQHRFHEKRKEKRFDFALGKKHALAADKYNQIALNTSRFCSFTNILDQRMN